MVKEINVYTNSDHLAKELAKEIASYINDTVRIEGICTIAISGGYTPIKLFNVLNKDYSNTILWDFVHIFWADERCVSPLDSDSNYRSAMIHLINDINIPEKNVHRIKGESDPEREASRYSYEISNNTKSKNHMPALDLVLLGLGEDGHTASIFPNQMLLLNSYKICNVSLHPQKNQKRITLSGRVINNARKIIFIATGVKKSNAVAAILEDKNGVEKLPAYYISPLNGSLQWHIDREAAKFLK